MIRTAYTFSFYGCVYHFCCGLLPTMVYTPDATGITASHSKYCWAHLSKTNLCRFYNVYLHHFIAIELKSVIEIFLLTMSLRSIRQMTNTINYKTKTKNMCIFASFEWRRYDKDESKTITLRDEKKGAPWKRLYILIKTSESSLKTPTTHCVLTNRLTVLNVTAHLLCAPAGRFKYIVGYLQHHTYLWYHFNFVLPHTSDSHYNFYCIAIAWLFTTHSDFLPYSYAAPKTLMGIVRTYYIFILCKIIPYPLQLSLLSTTLSIHF